MRQTFIMQLRELIRKLILDLSLNNLFIRDVLDEQRNRALDIAPNNAMQLIKELQDSLYKIEYSENWPLLRIYISFCYCILNDLHSARIWAEDAVRILNATNKEWNLAFVYWFLAAIYGEDGYFKDSREQYISAQKIFHKIMINTLNNNVGYRLKKECSKRINQIKYWISIIASDRSRLFDSVRKEQKVQGFTVVDEPNSAEAGDNNRVNNVLSSPTNLNIHFPIDIRLTDVDTSIPFDLNLFNMTEDPRISKSNPSDKTNADDSNKEFPIPTNIPAFTYLLTPGLPIYGKATAGPDGHVTLDDPDYSGTVDESPAVRIEGKEYKLRSLKQGDNQIGISYDDFYKSLSSLNEAIEFRGKQYGWLKVSGNSMNDAGLIPIENGDYVLFYENRNPRIEQIIIACLPGPDLQNLPLVVKRLKLKNGKLILRSESCDKDVNYPDIVINREQLLGEVVAIAEPKDKRSKEK